MAGTVRGRIECLSNTGNQYLNGQELFTNIYQFLKTQLEPAGVVTEIARNNGASGTGTDFHNQANPFGNNAWYVFRWNSSTQGNPTASRTWPWYMLVQWFRADQAGFGTSPGNPGLIDAAVNLGGSSSGVAIACAIGIGGDENPWNGTTALGSATKGSSVWKVPTGGTSVMVWPRSNNAGDMASTNGTHMTNKENTQAIWGKNGNGVQLRYHILADSDSFIWIGDDDNDGFYNGMYNGVYIPRSGISATHPFIQISANPVSSYAANVQIGALTGIGGVTLGAISAVGSRGCRQMIMGRYDEFFTTTTQPNQAFNPAQYDEFPLSFGYYEFASHFGYLGQVEFLRETFNIANLSTNSDSSRAFLGNPSNNTIKWSVPWSAAVVPGSGTTRTGTNF